jgi:hypothetical protein
MNHLPFKSLLVGLVLTAGIATTSCKGKNKNANNTGADTTTMMNAPAEQAPVTINEDETLNRGLVDATKDYPGVNATVNNGEITLTGTLERSKLPNLMTSLNSLRAKKINNNLTLK